jgi:Mn2+/Fe2+ NRAMP family transporter
MATVDNALPKANRAPMPEGFDPYRLDPADVQEPPATFWQTVRLLGPGMILAASIVGSGELIATTTLGAQVGYTALWVILLSCLIKPIIQEELGRHTIVSGVTTLGSFNRIPGLKVFSVSWIVLAWAVMVLLTLLQVGAMFGGVAQVMHILVPAVSVNLWVLVFLAVTLALLIGGRYDRIEGIAMVKVGLFTMLTILAAVLLMNMPKYFSWNGILHGFRFRLPGAGLSTAVAVLGITGVGTMELVIYPYWCVEKGYARFTGARDNSLDWQRRARGWIRVMRIDIVVSVFVYTIATVAFYLLGAGVLHGMGLVPSSSEMIPTLSRIYTETLGAWALWLFYIGAIATLYGTIFAATAAHSRLFADLAQIMNRFKKGDYRARVRYRNGFVVLLTAIPVIFYLVFEAPVKMVVAGGLAQAMMLPVVSWATVYLHHRKVSPETQPAKWVTVFLWAVSFFLTVIMIYFCILKISGL